MTERLYSERGNRFLQRPRETAALGCPGEPSSTVFAGNHNRGPGFCGTADGGCPQVVRWDRACPFLQLRDYCSVNLFSPMSMRLRSSYPILRPCAITPQLWIGP